MNAIQRECIALCDPESRLPLPTSKILARMPPSVLCRWAQYHGVHHLLAANLRHPARKSGYPPDWVAATGDLLTHASLGDAARTLLLRSEGLRLAATLRSAGFSIMLLKGVDFADHLYPFPGLRSSTDIDLLVRQRDFAAVGDHLQSLGCVQVVEHGRKHRAAYGEEAFLYSVAGMEVRVELHWDLVNSPRLRTSISLGYDDLIAPDGTVHNEGRLLMAAVHGGTGHQFDRLKFLVDLWQIFRRSEGQFDTEWLGQRMRQTGAAPLLAMACHLVQKLFGETGPQKLRRQLLLPPPSLFRRWLLRPGVLLAAEPGWTDKLRKAMYRQLLKQRGTP